MDLQEVRAVTLGAEGVPVLALFQLRREAQEAQEVSVAVAVVVASLRVVLLDLLELVALEVSVAVVELVVDLAV